MNELNKSILGKVSDLKKLLTLNENLSVEYGYQIDFTNHIKNRVNKGIEGFDSEQLETEDRKCESMFVKIKFLEIRIIQRY